MIRTRDHARDAWRAPPVPERHKLIHDEPGRVHDRKASGGSYDVCYRSHWYRVTQDEVTGAYALHVRHGGGEERSHLCHRADPLAAALAALESDARYFVLHALYERKQDGAKEAADRTTRAYCEAFVSGRLKKRKRRGTDTYDVRIEP